MNGGLLGQCPSCGGSSLSTVGDGAILVCDDCHEQFQGYRQEEMDDEAAAHIAVFARQSQEAQRGVRALNAAAADARAAIRKSVKLSPGNRTFTLYKSIILISRAIIDALVENGYAPDTIIDPCYHIVVRWVQVCQTGHLRRIKGASPQNFSLHCILAFVSLAALYVRCPLLPRDICLLAFSNRIPYMSAAADLLDPEILLDDVLRRALTVQYIHTGMEVSHLACLIGVSEYAWPPLKEFFDGQRALYTHEWHGDVFPLGHYDTTLRRLIWLLGLPEGYVDRVKRYRELHVISASMAHKTHKYVSEYAKNGIAPDDFAPTNCDTETPRNTDTGTNEDSFGVQKSPSANQESVLDTRVFHDMEVDQEGSSVPAPESRALPGDQRLDTPRNNISPPEVQDPNWNATFSQMVLAQENENSATDNAHTESSSQHISTSNRGSCVNSFRSSEDGSHDRGSWRDGVFTYQLPGGISSFPFTKQYGHRTTSLIEFPTARTIIVDIVNTLRICFAVPEYDKSLSKLRSRGLSESMDEKQQREKEWDSCYDAMRKTIDGVRSDVDGTLWSALSPPALASMRGDKLRTYVANSLASIDGSTPIYMRDHENAFQTLSRQGLDSVRDRGQRDGHEEIADEQMDASDGSENRPVHFGNWIWTQNSTPRSLSGKQRLKGVPDVQKTDMIDSLPGVNRDILLRIRGVVTNRLNEIGVCRGIRRKAWQGEEILVKEPAALGWAVHIMQRFFHGTFAHVTGNTTQDAVMSRNIAQCCDLSLSLVFNYLDIYLGEEGELRGTQSTKERNTSLPKRYTALSNFRKGQFETRTLSEDDVKGHFHLHRAKP